MNSTTSHTNLNYLRLMADGDREMEQTMLEMLITELSEEFEKMQSFQQVANWAELARVSHKMKSTLAFIGNEEMTHANRRIEQLVKSGTDLQQVKPLLDIFGNLLPEVVEELRQTLDNY